MIAEKTSAEGFPSCSLRIFQALTAIIPRKVLVDIRGKSIRLLKTLLLIKPHNIRECGLLSCKGAPKLVFGVGNLFLQILTFHKTNTLMSYPHPTPRL